MRFWLGAVSQMVGVYLCLLAYVVAREVHGTPPWKRGRPELKQVAALLAWVGALCWVVGVGIWTIGGEPPGPP